MSFSKQSSILPTILNPTYLTDEIFLVMQIKFLTMKIYLHRDGGKTTSRGIFTSIPQGGNLSITFAENNHHAFGS